MVATAFVFPGQGSQSLGMLFELAAKYSMIIKTFVEASEAAGYDVWSLVQNGPEEQLNQTEYTQVAMLTADVAVHRLLCEQEVPLPKIMAGHSLGEYAALVAANSLTLVDAVQLVARRGQLMQEAIPLGVGSMAALVGLTDEQVSQLCDEASQPHDEVAPANFNAIGQVVVAGHTNAVKRLLVLAEKAQARLAKIIPVSVPCHCVLLKEAAHVFAESLSKVEFKPPVIDVISNVDLSAYESAEQIRAKLKEQLYSPVRWVETIQLFKNKGIERIVECGPGKVLAGLIKRIDKTVTAISVYDSDGLNQVLMPLCNRVEEEG